MLQELEMLLPPRPEFVLPPEDQLEEVDMQDYDPNERRGNEGARGEAYNDDEEMHFGPGLQCAQQ